MGLDDDLMAVQKPTSQGRWVTMHGTHVFIGKGGQIEKGPAGLVKSGGGPLGDPGELDVGPGEPGFQEYAPSLPPADPHFRPLARTPEYRSPEWNRKATWADETRRQAHSVSNSGLEVIREYQYHGDHVTRSPEKSRKLEEALNQFSLPDNVTVYRKTGAEEGALSRLPIGKTVRNPRFVSTSTSEAVAQNFTGSRMLEIRLPRGARAVDTSHLQVENPAESEVLINRNQRYRVVAQKRDRTVLELVP